MALNPQIQTHLSTNQKHPPPRWTNEKQRMWLPAASMLSGSCSLSCRVRLRTQVSPGSSCPAQFPKPITSTSSVWSVSGDLGEAGCRPDVGRKDRPLLRLSGWWPTGVLGRRLLNCNAASLAGSSSHDVGTVAAVGPPRGTGSSAPSAALRLPPDPTRDYFSLMDWHGGRFLETRLDG